MFLLLYTISFKKRNTTFQVSYIFSNLKKKTAVRGMVAIPILFSDNYTYALVGRYNFIIFM
jgi:hypothetical protein